MKDLIFPPQCVQCSAQTGSSNGLCGSCWGTAHFIDPRTSCDACGTPLSGYVRSGDLCNACFTNSPIWSQGRAAMIYEGAGRQLVMKFKHSDRTDLAPALANWLGRSIEELITDKTVFVPVPLHWKRSLKRKYNQSALISDRLSKTYHRPALHDLLIRNRHTPSLKGYNKDERAEILKHSMTLNPKYQDHIKGADIILIDDVLTTGATLTACCTSLQNTGANKIDIAVLARVAHGQ